MLDDQEEESWPKTYYKKTKKYMKRKLKSSKKDKGKKKNTKIYKDVKTQIELQTRYLLFLRSSENISQLNIHSKQNDPFYTMIHLLATFKSFNVLKVQF